jgi:mono/diheme cytochrome c family protein
MPVVAGLLLSLVVGGGGFAGYSWWTQRAESQTGLVAAQQFLPTDAKPAVAGAAIAGPADNRPSTGESKSALGLSPASLAATQLTSDVASKDQEQEALRQQALEQKLIPYLKTHCVDCHGTDLQESGIAVHDLNNIDQLLKDRKKWERVYRMINAGAMPPSDYEPRPDEPVRKEAADLLNAELFNFDCAQIHHPGRSTLHRLNRAEYNNTIRDLFGLSITPADKFPQDDVGEGFDNNGDVLSVPPLLMEKYLDAAEEVATAVIDTRDFSKGLKTRFDGAQMKPSQNSDTDGDGFRMLASNGTLEVEYEAPAEGKYRIRIEAAATQAGDDDAEVELQIDGMPVQKFQVKGHRKPAWHEHELTLSEGNRKIAAAFTNDFYDESLPERRRDRNLMVRAIEIEGPEGGSPPRWHELHRKFVTAVPGNDVSVMSAATTVLRPILYRAFRRPVSDSEVARYASLTDQTVSEHQETYEYGVFVALQAILVSPDFLFRKETDPTDGATERQLNEYEIASKLSYFLWSTMPDEELFQLAENKRLLDRDILRQQIERMLKDEKADALSRNFASQWLNLRNLIDVRPNRRVFEDFDDSLREAMMKETELLFNSIVKEDRSIEEFLSADFTHVNERLAKHYGISGVSGDEFVRVSLQGTNRTGVLTHASILTLTSNPGRTSPVKRGKWIMENILGEAPPPAPPGVPPLEDAARDVSDLSLRERLEVHRKDPGCASCHKAMDPLGMGFENFDAVGRWRDEEGKKPVDASGDLPSGQKFSGPLELISILREKNQQFYRTFTERLMVYALGRGLEYYDKCAVDHTLDLAKERGYRFSALVEGIVTSDPFMKRSLNREMAP